MDTTSEASQPNASVHGRSLGYLRNEVTRLRSIVDECEELELRRLRLQAASDLLKDQRRAQYARQRPLAVEGVDDRAVSGIARCYQLGR